MAFSTLISTVELAGYLDDPEWVIVDCRFSLADTERGRRDYLASHIPGAVYAHLDDDLSGPVVAGRTGRHPLPAVEVFAQRLGEWGISDGSQVVAYDDAAGSIAARLWWMLRWLGHEAVAVLNGGWQQWLDGGLPERGGRERRVARTFKPQLQAQLLVDTVSVAAMIETRPELLFDSRTADRYRGENETIDPVAGHIPGAVNAPYPENVGPDGLFLARETLRARFAALLAEGPVEQTAFYCGSGVTAAHNLLAMAHAGLGDGRLYAGSWSEWIAAGTRPVAQE